MNPASLPYSVLLLLAEFSIGGQLVLFALDVRGRVTRGLVRAGAVLIVTGTALTVWLSLAVAATSRVDTYPLAAQWFGPARASLVLLLATVVVYTWLAWRGRDTSSLAAGLVAGLVALIALGFLTAIVQEPTWSYAGTYLSLLAGGVALGGVTLAMTLGHWYLVTPRLPEQPLNELTLALLVVFAAQILLLAINLAAPVRQAVASAGIGTVQNPALWLRVGVGLVLPIVLGTMAWQSSRARGMMSATGLLYLATGAILAGEALACALLFSTAIPG